MKSGLEIRDIRKSFGSNEVLKGISFDVKPGEIVSLLGANGAGKSTLIKILSGAYSEFTGEIVIDGSPVIIGSPLQARLHGIETVHQKINEGIVAGLTVAENLLFDRIATEEISTLISPKKMVKKSKELLKELALDWPDSVLRDDVFNLGIADQQLLLLSRGLSHKPSLLILDEPTSALSTSEISRLFKIIQKLREDGVAILYVSHRLGEIDEIADRLVVLRDGVIQAIQSRPFQWKAALHEMLGDESATEIENRTELVGEEAALKVVGAQIFPNSKPWNIEIRKGEVTGVIGLLGAGKSEFAKSIFGASQIVSGTFELDGIAFQPNSPRESIKSGIFFISENRAKEGIFDGWSIGRTNSLPFIKRLSKRNFINFSHEKSLADEMIKKVKVVAQSQSVTVDSLSGGNQQKVMVGRWLMHKAKLLILDEPFRGVDIGARREISRQIRSLVAEDCAALIFSSDIDEILESCDRILVLVDGEIRFDRYLSKTSRDEIIGKMSEVA